MRPRRLHRFLENALAAADDPLAQPRPRASTLAEARQIALLMNLVGGTR
jgi:hypothetical protein